MVIEECPPAPSRLSPDYVRVTPGCPPGYPPGDLRLPPVSPLAASGCGPGCPRLLPGCPPAAPRTFG